MSRESNERGPTRQSLELVVIAETSWETHKDNARNYKGLFALIERYESSIDNYTDVSEEFNDLAQDMDAVSLRLLRFSVDQGRALLIHQATINLLKGIDSHIAANVGPRKASPKDKKISLAKLKQLREVIGNVAANQLNPWQLTALTETDADLLKIMTKGSPHANYGEALLFMLKEFRQSKKGSLSTAELRSLLTFFTKQAREEGKVNKVVDLDNKTLVETLFELFGFVNQREFEDLNPSDHPKMHKIVQGSDIVVSLVDFYRAFADGFFEALLNPEHPCHDLAVDFLREMNTFNHIETFADNRFDGRQFSFILATSLIDQDLLSQRQVEFPQICLALSRLGQDSPVLAEAAQTLIEVSRERHDCFPFYANELDALFSSTEELETTAVHHDLVSKIEHAKIVFSQARFYLALQEGEIDPTDLGLCACDRYQVHAEINAHTGVINIMVNVLQREEDPTLKKVRFVVTTMTDRPEVRFQIHDTAVSDTVIHSALHLASKMVEFLDTFADETLAERTERAETFKQKTKGNDVALPKRVKPQPEHPQPDSKKKKKKHQRVQPDPLELPPTLAEEVSSDSLPVLVEIAAHYEATHQKALRKSKGSAAVLAGELEQTIARYNSSPDEVKLRLITQLVELEGPNGETVWRLKLNENDARAFIVTINGRAVVFAVERRDKAYTKGTIDSLRRRLTQVIDQECD